MHLPVRPVLVALGLALVACAVNKPASSSASQPEPAAERPAGLAFGWQPGDRFALVHRATRDGAVVEIRTNGRVSALGKDRLQIVFESPLVASGDRKKLGADQSHAGIDQWPSLTVARATGELVEVGGGAGPAADVATQRWQLWTAPIGFDLEAGNRRTYETEVEAGDGLVLPVQALEERRDLEGGRTEITMGRSYGGEPTKQLWAISLAESGAPKADIDALKSVTREERMVVETDPGTFRHTRLVQSETTIVISQPKKAKTPKEERREVVDEYVFTWTR